jgi:hypothetical protein
LVERLVWDQEAAGSNPVAPIDEKTAAECCESLHVSRETERPGSPDENGRFRFHGVKGAPSHAQAKREPSPVYRLHKQSGQAIVTLNGRDVLLGKHGSAASKAKLAMKPVRQLHGGTRAADFGLRCLKAVVQHMIDLKRCRTSINKHAARIEQMLNWAVENELVTAPARPVLSAEVIDSVGRLSTAFLRDR